MRIQTVRFKNLNSLAGEWLIDFTDPHFTSSGIFAIVGATGAGKTTILDAISLALYGRTPRLKQISKSTNEIMSRQAGDCFSEVEFTSSKGTFRVHWSQHRARKISTGDLQAPKHEFVLAQGNKVLATKLKDVAEHVTDATGMDFDQFTRSMLLAQGDFSKFLQASSDQRAPILEQITGTEIYSQISKQVHQCKIEEEKKLDLLQNEIDNLHILSQEEIKIVLEKQVAAAENANILQEQIKITNLGLNWHQTLENLFNKKKELETALSQLLQKWDSATPLREQVEKAIQHHLLQGSYNHLTQLRTSQIEEQNLLSLTTSQIKQLEGTITSLRLKKQTAEEHYNAACKNQQAQTEVIKVVRQLDYEIQKFTQEIKEIENDTALFEKNLSIQTETKKTSDKQITSCLEAISKIHDYQKSNHADETLLETLSGIEEKHVRLTQLSTTIKKTENYISHLQIKLKEQKTKEKQKQSKIQKLIEQEQQLITQIDNGQKILITHAPQGLPPLYQIMQKLRDDFNNYSEIQRLVLEQKQTGVKHDLEKKNLKTFTEQIAISQTTIAQTKDLIRLQKGNVAKQEEIALLASKIQGFEKERTKLADNTPCPLCGSTDHPFIKSTTLQTDEVNKTLYKEKQKLDTLESRSKSQEIEMNRLLFGKETCITSIAELTEKQDLLNSRIHNLCPDNIIQDNIDNTIAEIKDSILVTKQRLQEAEKHNQDITRWEQELKQLSPTLNSHKDQLRQHQQKSETIEAELTLNIATVKTSSDDVSRQMQDLSELVAPYTKVSFTNEEEIHSTLQKLREKQILWKNALSSLREQEIRHQGFIASRDRAVQSIEMQKKEQVKLFEKRALLINDRKRTLAKRHHLFEDRDPLAVEKEIHDKWSIAENSLKNIQEELVRKEKEISILLERKGQLIVSTTKRTETLQNEEDAFLLLLNQHNFESETTFCNAKLPDDKREQLKLQLNSLETQCKETKAKLSSIDESIAEESAKETTKKSSNTLLQKLEEQTAALNLLQQSLGALAEKIKTYENNIKHQQHKQKQLAQQQKEYGYWAQLHTLIGSADGKKFRNFAQGLTFELMVHHANQTLDKMSDRYLLKRSPNAPLELTVIDAYQAGEIRSTANLSGGETFIISLALALGLSTMAGQKVQIDSLFLDEGFGTLDEESLEIALETLSTLQQSGKIIGIISHVPLLRERIDVQIHLLAGLDGTSRISGPGVSSGYVQ